MLCCIAIPCNNYVGRSASTRVLGDASTTAGGAGQWNNGSVITRYVRCRVCRFVLPAVTGSRNKARAHHELPFLQLRVGKWNHIASDELLRYPSGCRVDGESYSSEKKIKKFLLEVGI